MASLVHFALGRGVSCLASACICSQVAQVAVVVKFFERDDARIDHARILGLVLCTSRKVLLARASVVFAILT